MGKAQEMGPVCNFAFAWATFLNTPSIELGVKELLLKD